MDKKELEGIKKEERMVVGFEESRTFVMSQKKERFRATVFSLRNLFTFTTLQSKTPFIRYTILRGFRPLVI